MKVYRHPVFFFLQKQYAYLTKMNCSCGILGHTPISIGVICWWYISPSFLQWSILWLSNHWFVLNNRRWDVCVFFFLIMLSRYSLPLLSVAQQCSLGARAHCAIFTRTSASIYLSLNAVAETLFVQVKSQNKMHTNTNLWHAVHQDNNNKRGSSYYWLMEILQ